MAPRRKLRRHSRRGAHKPATPRRRRAYAVIKSTATHSLTADLVETDVVMHERRSPWTTGQAPARASTCASAPHQQPDPTAAPAIPPAVTCIGRSPVRISTGLDLRDDPPPANRYIERTD